MKIVGFCLIAFSILAIVVGTKGPLDIVGFIVFVSIGIALIKKGNKAVSKTSDVSVAKRERTTKNNTSTETTPYPKQKIMVCVECGKTYPLGQVYCDECGSLLREQVKRTMRP